MTESRLAAAYVEVLSQGAPQARLAADYTEVLSQGAPQARLAADYVEVLQAILPPAANLVSAYTEVLQAAVPPPPPLPDPPPAPPGLPPDGTSIVSKYQQGVWLDALAGQIDGVALGNAGGALTQISPVTMEARGLRLVNTTAITLSDPASDRLFFYAGTEPIFSLPGVAPIPALKAALGLAT